MKKDNQKILKRKRKVVRIRALVKGTAQRPRVAVYRTQRHISAQFIDDDAQKTILSVSDTQIDSKNKKPIEVASELGAFAAEKALASSIQAVVLDRRHYKYHGRVKSFADGMREKGLKL